MQIRKIGIAEKPTIVRLFHGAVFAVSLPEPSRRIGTSGLCKLASYHIEGME